MIKLKNCEKKLSPFKINIRPKKISSLSNKKENNSFTLSYMYIVRLCFVLFCLYAKAILADLIISVKFKTEKSENSKTKQNLKKPKMYNLANRASLEININRSYKKSK